MKEVSQVVLVVPPGRKEGIPGGERRQDSVLQGLAKIEASAEVVLVHDSARPFVTPELVRRVIQGAMEHGAAVPGVGVRDTIKKVAGGLVEATVDRNTLQGIQTPQGFRKGLLEAAYASGHGIADATDDAQIVERAGGKVAVVGGDPENFKITSKSDLDLADIFLRRRRPRTSRGTPGILTKGQSGTGPASRKGRGGRKH